MTTTMSRQEYQEYQEYNIPFQKYQSISCPMGTFDLHQENEMVKALRFSKGHPEIRYYDIFLFLLAKSRKYTIKKSIIVSVDTIQKYCTLHQGKKTHTLLSSCTCIGK